MHRHWKTLALSCLSAATLLGAAQAGGETTCSAKEKADKCEYVAELFARVVASREGECDESYEASNEPWEKLSMILQANPDAWQVVTPLALASFEGDGCAVERQNVVSLLAWQYSPRAYELAAQIEADHPAYFETSHVVAFAEAGSKHFWKAAKKLAHEGEVLPLALLAIHGKSVDRAPLVRAASAEIAPDTLSRTFLSALALAKQGEPAHLKSAHERLRLATLSALDEGEVDAAGHLALAAQFLHEQFSSYAKLRVSFLDTRLAWHCQEGARKTHSPDDVFTMVEQLAAL